MPKKDDPARERRPEESGWERPAMERLGLQGILLALALASLPGLEEDVPAAVSGAEPDGDDPAAAGRAEEVDPGLEPAFALPPLPGAPAELRRTAWRRHWVVG